MAPLLVGRLRGIPIVLRPSWIVLALVLIWMLTAMLRRDLPEQGVALSLAVATLGALLVLASVAAHELGHALAAAAFGIPTQRIEISLLGGAAVVDHEPTTPGADVAIALAGPAVTLVLAGLLHGAHVLLAPFALSVDGRGWTEPIVLLSPMLAWLSWINLAVGLFNLLPSFPLDGGRVLRAALWAVRGDAFRATRGALRVAVAVAWSCVALGAYVAFGDGGRQLPISPSGGVWLLLIGWLLRFAAHRSHRRLLAQHVLRKVTVRQLVRHCPPPIPDTLPLDAVAFHDEPALLVAYAGVVVGLLREGDLQQLPRSRWAQTRVCEVMVSVDRIGHVTPDDTVMQAIETFARSQATTLPVLEDGVVVGLLHYDDLVCALTQPGEIEHSAAR